MGIVGFPSFRQHFLRALICVLSLAGCGRIGVSGESPSIRGLLDDVTLFSQPQSAVEVQTLYTMPSCGL